MFEYRGLYRCSGQQQAGQQQQDGAQSPGGHAKMVTGKAVAMLCKQAKLDACTMKGSPDKYG
jgi:hypothetical protein